MNPFYLLFLSTGLALAAAPGRRAQGEEPGCPAWAGGCIGRCANGVCMTTGGIGFPCGDYNGKPTTCDGMDGAYCQAFGDAATRCQSPGPNETSTFSSQSPTPTPAPKQKHQN